jgi:hypothetical protein
MKQKTFLRIYLLGAVFGLATIAFSVLALSLHGGEVPMFVFLVGTYAAFLTAGQVLLFGLAYSVTRKLTARKAPLSAYPIVGLIFSVLAAYMAVILMDLRRFPITLTIEYWQSSQLLLLPAYLAGAVQGGVIGWHVMRRKQ